MANMPAAIAAGRSNNCTSGLIALRSEVGDPEVVKPVEVSGR